MTARPFNRTLTTAAPRVALLPALAALALVVLLVSVSPAYAKGPSGSDAQIDGGGRATCAFTTTGAVHCWGAGESHQ